MGSVNLVQIFRTFVNVKKLQNLFSRNNAVEVTVNKQNWHVTVDFFENLEIINLKNIALNFFDCSLLDKEQERLD